METVHWSSNFNSAFHVNSSSLPFNFNRNLVKNSSFNELGSNAHSSFDSIAVSKLDVGMFPSLSSAVLAASSSSYVPSAAMSPFFHSLPSLSRSISSDYTATPAVANVDNLELESPDSDSRSLCLSPDESADREQTAQEMADLDSPQAEHSPRSDADSDEWSVPSTNMETDNVNHSHIQALPIIKNSSLLDIAEAMRVVPAVKKEEFSDSEDENDNEVADSQPEDSDEEDKEAEQDDDDEEAPAAEEAEADSEPEEVEVAAPRKSRAQPKRSKQHTRSVGKQSRRGSNSSSANRRAPISSAARLASQKKYDEKRRGIYRCLYSDLKDAIRAAQQVEGVKKEAQDERAGEVKKGKKKKKKKQKEIEDLSTRELLMLASNTIAQLQNVKNQMDEEWSTLKVQAAADDDDEDSGVKAADRKRKRGSGKTERTTKSTKRGQPAADCELSSPKRSRTESSSSSSTSVLCSPTALLSALSNSIGAHGSSVMSFTASPPSAAPSAVRGSGHPVKSEPSSSSSSSPLLLVGASTTSSPPSAHESKRRAIFRLLFLRLRALIIGNRPVLSLLNSSAGGRLWCSILVSLLHSEWSEEEMHSMPVEKLFVKTAEVIAALQWLLEEIEKSSADTQGQLKEQWSAVARVKREMEAVCAGTAADDSADDC